MSDNAESSDRFIGRTFMERTRYRYLEPSAQQRRVPQPPLTLPPDSLACALCIAADTG